jgi:phasin family protein
VTTVLNKTMDAVTLLSELRKLIDQFKTPGAQVQKLIEARQKDFDVLIEATRTSLDGAQSLTAKQTELLHGAVDELSGILQQVSKPTALPGAGAKVSAELLQKTVHAALESMSDLLEIATKSQAKTVDMLTKRIHENVEEWMRLLRLKQAPDR